MWRKNESIIIIDTYVEEINKKVHKKYMNIKHMLRCYVFGIDDGKKNQVRVAKMKMTTRERKKKWVANGGGEKKQNEPKSRWNG